MLVPETSQRQRTPRPPAPRPRRCRRPSLASSVDPPILLHPRQPVNLQSSVDLTNAHRRADQTKRAPIEKAASEHGSPAPVVSNGDHGDVAAKPAKRKRRLPLSQLSLVPSVYVDLDADVAADDLQAYDRAAVYSQPSDPIEEAHVQQGKRPPRGRGTAHSASPRTRLSSLKNTIRLPKPSADNRPNKLSMFKLPREANRKANTPTSAWLSRHGSDGFIGSERSVPYTQTRRGRRGPLIANPESLQVVPGKLPEPDSVPQDRDFASANKLTLVGQISPLSSVSTLLLERGNLHPQHAKSQIPQNANDSMASASPPGSFRMPNLDAVVSLPLSRTMAPTTALSDGERTYNAHNNQTGGDYDLV